MPRTVVAWQVSSFRTITRCAVSEHDDGYHVVVARGDDVLVNEVHASCDVALKRAEDLRSQLRGRPRGGPPRPLTRH